MSDTKQKFKVENRKKLVETKFEDLCSSVTCQQVIWNQCLANIFNLKNELLKHPLPPSLMLKLAITHSELLRSQSDLIAPVQELVRLVLVYRQSLEDKSIALKRIDEENERRKVELDIAVRKLEQSYNYEKQWRNDHTLNNWERIFCKAALNRTHGRRWKFVISKVKQRASLGLSVFNPMIDPMSDDEDMKGGIVGPRFTYGSTTNSSVRLTKQSGATSHFTSMSGHSTVKQSSAAQSTTAQSSAVQSSLLSSSLKLDTSGETDDDDEDDDDDDDTQDTEPMASKDIKSPSVLKSSSKNKILTRDISISTEDIEYDKILKIFVYNPIGFKLPYNEISCKFNLLENTQESEILDSSGEAKYCELNFLFEGSAYKNLGYKRGTTIGALLEDDISEQLEVTIHCGQERKVFAISTIPIEDISDSQPELRDDINEDDIVPKPFPIFALEGDVTAPCGYLPIFCVWQLKVRHKHMSVGTETDPVMIDNIIEDDDDSEENLEENLEEHVGEIAIDLSTPKPSPASPALSRKSVSVKIPTPKPTSEPTTPEPQYIEQERVMSQPSNTETDQLVEDMMRTHAQEMAIGHAQEIERLQYEYEMRLEQMAKSLEIMKMEQEEIRVMDSSRTPVSLVSCFSNNTRPSSNTETVRRSGRVEMPAVSIHHRPTTSYDDRKRKKKQFAKEDVLPQDFFERMEYFTRSSLERQKNLVMRVRDEVRCHTESTMETQHRLSKRITSADSADSGINEATQDLSLPAIFMPNKTGLIFSPKAWKYFHPPGCKEPRLSQAPSVFQLPHTRRTPTLNLFDLNQKNVIQNGPGWLYKTCKDVTKR